MGGTLAGPTVSSVAVFVCLGLVGAGNQPQLFSGTRFPFFGGLPTKNGLPQKGSGSLNN